MGDDSPGHEYIEAAGNHGLKRLYSISKLDKLHLQILALPESHRGCERKLAIDRQGMHVSRGHLRALC